MNHDNLVPEDNDEDEDMACPLTRPVEDIFDTNPLTPEQLKEINDTTALTISQLQEDIENTSVSAELAGKYKKFKYRGQNILKKLNKIDLAMNSVYKWSFVEPSSIFTPVVIQMVRQYAAFFENFANELEAWHAIHKEAK